MPHTTQNVVSTVPANFGLNGKLFMRFVVWWLITVPVALGIAYGIELIVRPSKP
jgi:phosphate/sulfate permease